MIVTGPLDLLVSQFLTNDWMPDIFSPSSNYDEEQEDQ